MHEFLFMGQPDHVESVRCRVYDATEEDPRAAFLRECEGPGAVDCPAYDQWVAALQERGWLPANPELVPNPDGPGRIGLWKLTPRGREEWAAIKGR